MNRWIPTDTAATIETLTEDRCWELVETARVGRIAVVADGGRVLVLPVNFVVEDRAIVFRTAPGAALDHLGTGSVTFQVDAIDQWQHGGWSVLAHGPVEIEAEPCDNDVPPEPWAGGHRRHRVRIAVEVVTGRAVRPLDHDWDPRGYL